MTIEEIYNYIKDKYNKYEIEYIFNELAKKYYIFDIQLGYIEYINELLNTTDISKETIDKNKLKMREARQDYQFKQDIKKFYNEKCIITDADIEECSICHIKPLYECNDDEKYDYRNGIILSESLHRLFDKYLFSINPDTLEIVISKNIQNKNLLINNYINKFVYINLESMDYLKYHYNKFIEM